MILQRRVFLLMMLLLVAAVTGATANPDVRDGCRERCGDVIVPYPFGIGEQRCAMNENFFLNCTSTDDGHHEQLWFGGDMPARNISLLNGTVTVGILASFDCYENSSGRQSRHSQQSRQSRLFNSNISLGSGPYTFSDSRNMFTAVGCDTISMATNKEATSGFGCLSLCTVNATMSKENSCLGSGCCHTAIPKGLKSLNITLQSFRNHTDVFAFNPCSFAFLEDKDSLDLSDWPLSRTPTYLDKSNVVIEWVAQNETCEEAPANKSSYACGINTNCYYSDNGQGYRCACKKGFEGNPYLEQGCQGKVTDALSSYVIEIKRLFILILRY
ncbi:wall-associated receptor kinase 2-like [Populus alba]|uniref:wall-associated receptor kinase 2-like n=1 Tax=Populus alba TaxID=43335 RepID=UPI001589E28D|nr:wall-associated receptor kinase 2-like [Populus alba]